MHLTSVAFDLMPLQQIPYEQTTHYQIYRDFMQDRSTYLEAA